MPTFSKVPLGWGRLVVSSTGSNEVASSNVTSGSSSFGRTGVLMVSCTAWDYKSFG